MRADRPPALARLEIRGVDNIASGFLIIDSSAEAAITARLDQEQAVADYFGARLTQAVESGKVSMARSV